MEHDFILWAFMELCAIIISLMAIFLWAMSVMPSILPFIVIIDASSHFVAIIASLAKAGSVKAEARTMATAVILNMDFSFDAGVIAL
jgi:hypothetical protein